ncbi:ABC transporter substrate-binding protein [Motiliproteus sp. MSK22-1]|uniref:ABC transporter substrate-binding protein n=1 Tax=Motiliproteus sp. MSK22-1 TaxID=1897630 RepID=UPI000978121A|nr:ABC transporter substrate-binding protein [Motiliproteus sp. MSK22-1]OMH33890.1 hypothetical protein BGP75_12990 [Motiliproteus sp. MSK22-1]
MKIAFFTTRQADDAYWGQVTAAMSAACRDLGIQLEVFYAGGNHITLIEQVESALKSPRRFDAIVVPNFKKTAHRNIKAAEQYKVPLLLFNSEISADRQLEMGLPREHFNYWIGTIVPDERQAGYRLAENLLKEAEKTLDHPATTMVAIGGNLADFSSINRLKGMEQAVKEHPQLQLLQTVHANWNRKTAAQMYHRLHQRYPNNTVVWTASDLMALGVLDQASTAQRTVITGGVDWTQQGLESIIQGELSFSLGGHYFNGAWAAVMLYDYFHGRDFKQESVRILTPMLPLGITQSETIKQLLHQRIWEKVNFRLYSKALNPDITHYNFSVPGLEPE